MKTSVTTAAVLAAFLFLTACVGVEGVKRYAVNTAQVAQSVVALDASYNGLADALAANASAFSVGEQARLRSIDADLQALRAEAHSLAAIHGGVAEALIRADAVASLYGRARSAYVSARRIVSSRELPPALRRQLSAFDREAVLLDAAVAGLAAAPDGTNISGNVTTALRLAAGAAKLIKALAH